MVSLELEPYRRKQTMVVVRALAMVVFCVAVLLCLVSQIIGLPLPLQEFAEGRGNTAVIFAAFVIVAITELFRNRNVYF